MEICFTGTRKRWRWAKNALNLNAFKLETGVARNFLFLSSAFRVCRLKHFAVDFLNSVRNKVMFKNMPTCQIWPIFGTKRSITLERKQISKAIEKNFAKFQDQGCIRSKVKRKRKWWNENREKANFVYNFVQKTNATEQLWWHFLSTLFSFINIWGIPQQGVGLPQSRGSPIPWSRGSFCNLCTRQNGHRDKLRCYRRFHDQGRSSDNFENGENYRKFPIFEVVWWSTLVMKPTVATKFVSVSVLPCA